MGISNRCNTRNGSKNINFDYNNDHGFENENNYDDNKTEDENSFVQNLNKNEHEQKKIINQVNSNITTDVIKEHIIDNFVNPQESKSNEEYHIDSNEGNSKINHFKNNNLEMNDSKENIIINLENDNYDENCLKNDTIPKVCNNDHNNIEDNHFDVNKMTEKNMPSHLFLQTNGSENKEMSVKDMNINDYNMENDSNYMNSNSNSNRSSNKQSEEDMFAKNSQKDNLSPYNKSDKSVSTPAGVYVIRINGVVQAWRAEWKSSNGCKKTKNFGISTYGYDLSKKLAIEMRARMSGECLVADDGTIFDYRNKIESKDE